MIISNFILNNIIKNILILIKYKFIFFLLIKILNFYFFLIVQK